MAKGVTYVIFRIVFAIIGAISGVSIFFAFIALRNIHAAIWGLLSTVFALISLSILLAYRRKTLLERFPLYTLRRLKHFGAFASFATIVAAITYFVLAGVLHQAGTHTEPPHLMQHVDAVSALRLLVQQNSYQIENDGYMPAGVFSLLTLKWTAFLYFYSKKFEKIYTERLTEPIANGEPYKTLTNSME